MMKPWVGSWWVDPLTCVLWAHGPMGVPLYPSDQTVIESRLRICSCCVFLHVCEAGLIWVRLWFGRTTLVWPNLSFLGLGWILVQLSPAAQLHQNLWNMSNWSPRAKVFRCFYPFCHTVGGWKIWVNDRQQAPPHLDFCSSRVKY